MSSTRQTDSLLARYRRLMAPRSWRQLATGIALGTATGAFNGAALVSLLPASVALASGQPQWGLDLARWLVVLGVLAVLAGITDFLGSRTGYLGALGFIEEVLSYLGAKVASLPLGWFRQDSPAVLSRLATQEMMALGESAAHFMYSLFRSLAASAVIILGAWFWDWHLGLLLTACCPLLWFFLRLGRRLLNHGRRLTTPHEVQVAARIVEHARCQAALRSCHAASGYPELREALAEDRRVGRRALWIESAGQLVGQGMVQVMVVGAIALTATLGATGTMPALATVATLGLALRFTSMLLDIGASLTGLEERRQMMNSVEEVMNVAPLPEPSSTAGLPRPGEVRLDQVDFGYEPGTPVLRQVSAVVPPRSLCAVVGPSGCGKTTILRLVARFYDVTGGQVSVGGTDVREQTTEDLMAQLSMVFQDVYLFDDTLEANIRVGRPEATAEQVAHAARLAGVTEIVDRLPLGWQTRVGEGGRSLSGGERQRVSIARALLKQAPIVLLDEATSALDAENEANIVAAMDELRSTSTLLVVAHKLETIRAADQIIMLGADGSVAQHGTHDELVTTEGPYRDFWSHRQQAVGWALV